MYNIEVGLGEDLKCLVQLRPPASWWGALMPGYKTIQERRVLISYVSP